MKNAETYWFYTINQTKFGPFSESAIVEQIRNRIIKKDTEVWTIELGAWTPLSQTDLKRFVPPPPLNKSEPIGMPATSIAPPTQSTIVPPATRETGPVKPKLTSPFSRASKAFWIVLSFVSMAMLAGGAASNNAPFYITFLMAVIAGIIAGATVFPVALLWCWIFKPKQFS